MSNANLKRKPRRSATKRRKVITLADFKPEDGRDEYIRLPTPLGWHEGAGEPTAVQLDSDRLACFGIQDGDTVVFMKTADVRDFDIACALVGDELDAGRYIGKRGGLCRLENNDEARTYKREAIEGRAIGVIRDGFYVSINYPLRPIPNPALDRMKPANDLIN